MKTLIGVCSYRNPSALRNTLLSIRKQSATDWTCLISHNPSGLDDADDQEAIRIVRDEFISIDARFMLSISPRNLGYSGSVNCILNEGWAAGFDHIVYCDNDIDILTYGWDTQLCALLENHPKVAQVFPGAGHHGFFNGAFHECLWNAGYCWAIRASALTTLRFSDHLHKRNLSATSSDLEYPVSHYPYLDTSLGHHEEVDLMIRLRLAGYLIGCIPFVRVRHLETATQSAPTLAPRADDPILTCPCGKQFYRSTPSAEGGHCRICSGVVRWMNKWNRYFNGDILSYHNGPGYDPRMTRYTDWPPCALYLERLTLHTFPNWNVNPRSVFIPGTGSMDVVEIIKPTGPYKGRAI